jgi:uncharacterized membrane protein
VKRVAIIYIATLIILVPLDLLVLGTVGRKLFDSHVGDMLVTSPRLLPAALFYALYAAGVVVFVNGAAPANWPANAAFGGMFGLFCYATFELTNMSILRQWSWAVVIPDIVWGSMLTAITAMVAGLVASWLISATA